MSLINTGAQSADEMAARGLQERLRDEEAAANEENR